MTPPTDDMDMEFDPDGDADTGPTRSGPAMMWIGFLVMGVFILWDYFGSSPPSNPTYAILGVWLMLGTWVAISEVVYR